MEIPLIQDVVIVLGLAVLVILLFIRFRLPTIIGFLITGAIAGPHGLSLVKASEEVHIIAEIGVILLLFIIGLEFSLRSLIAIKRAVLLGGAVQVGLTILLVMVTAMGFGFPWTESLFLGFLFSLSSTAIVLKLLQERGEISSPHGRTILAILIFQDIIVVPMMLVTPMLTGESENLLQEILLLLAKGLFVIAFVLISARYIVPWLLFKVAQSKSKELFVLCIVVICFAVAWLTSSIGLSLALGAFMAGLIISESEYSHQATSNILPFREVFTSFFFISIGMLLDLGFLFDHLLLILALTVGAAILKTLVAAGAGLALGYPLRTALLLGLGIFQVGEFAFILSVSGIKAGLLQESVYQAFLSVSILTMVLTPFAISSGTAIVNFVLRLPFPEKLTKRNSSAQQAAAHEFEDLDDHLIIIGYGVNGRNVARAAKEASITYLILELNPETVRAERKKGEHILYGDAMHAHILTHVHVQKARVVVVAISDPVATKIIVSNIRQINSHVHIIVRTRLITEIEENVRAGANEVIPEEFETSIEIFTRVLTRYLVPIEQIETFTGKIRSDNYEMLRAHPGTKSPTPALLLDITDIDITTITVQQEPNEIVGRCLSQSDLKKNFGITLLAIKRQAELITFITGETEILQDDVLYILGDQEGIMRLRKKISL